jgi:pimeloyl-ACP methyl ester carboxylesterase
VDLAGCLISGDDAGQGPPILQLHGLTATRRYVTMGSRLLERRGFRQIGYDARGHGESGPAPAGTAYDYADLERDLEALMDHLGLERAILAGSSMGAATALAFALRRPERVAMLVQMTPAFDGMPYEGAEGLAWWDSLADGLETDGVEGFMRAYAPMITGRFADSIERLTRERIKQHSNPVELAKAVRAVPRSSAFDGLELLEGLGVPTLVIGSRDDADPGHPLHVAEEYARRIPVAELAVEPPGKPPIAWRGAQVSRLIVDFAARHGAGPAQAGS